MSEAGARRGCGLAMERDGAAPHGFPTGAEESSPGSGVILILLLRRESGGLRPLINRRSGKGCGFSGAIPISDRFCVRWWMAGRGPASDVAPNPRKRCRIPHPPFPIPKHQFFCPILLTRNTTLLGSRSRSQRASEGFEGGSHCLHVGGAGKGLGEIME